MYVAIYSHSYIAADGYFKSSSSSSHSGSCKGINSMCDPTNSRRREASDGGNDQTMKYYALMRNIMMHDDHAQYIVPEFMV